MQDDEGVRTSPPVNYDLVGPPTAIAPDRLIAHRFARKVDAAILGDAIGDVLGRESG